MSLVLYKDLRNLDDTIYEGMGKDEYNRGTSVGEEGLELIRKYGNKAEFTLINRFGGQFLYQRDENHGKFYGLMLKFFLENLPLLQRPSQNSANL